MIPNQTKVARLQSRSLERTPADDLGACGVHRASHNDLRQSWVRTRCSRWDSFGFSVGICWRPSLHISHVALALLLIPGLVSHQTNMIRYTVTDSKLEIDTGLIARTTRNIPLSKVQDVTYLQAFLNV
jgi:hypothetical protein